MKQFLRLIAIAVISAVLGGAVIRLEDFSWPRSDDAVFEQVFLEITGTPLLSAVLDDHPQTKDELRVTLRAIYDAGDAEKATDATRLAVSAIVTQYAAPMIAKADDAPAIGVMRASAAMVDALAKYHTGGCQGIFTGDMGNAPLIPQVKQALSDWWLAQSIAYASGKETKGNRQALSTDAAFAIMTDDLGITQQEAEAIATVDDNPDQEFCTVAAKLFRIDLVPIETRADYARAMLSP